MIMSDVATVALTKLFLWYDAGRIQTWPGLLSEIDPLATWPTPTHLARAVITERMTDGRHSSAVDVVRAWPGLETDNERLVLRGVGLLERADGGYKLSGRACELREVFLSKPGQHEWVACLASILLRYEPRTRILVRLLSAGGATIRFPRQAWFSGASSAIALQRRDADILFPFREPGAAGTDKTLRPYLHDWSWWALGEWRNDAALRGCTGCRLVGTTTEEPSLDRPARSLRPVLEVLLQLGVLVHEAGEVWLDSGVAADLLGPALAEEFGWETSPRKTATAIDHIRDLLPKLQADTGLVVASEMRRELSARGIADPDREIGKLMQQRKLILERTDHGQPRHGEGLFGDPEKQLIKIRILGGHQQ